MAIKKPTQFHLEIVFIMAITIATLFANYGPYHGGHDWYAYYKFIAAFEPSRGYVPYFAVYILAPLSIFPERYQWTALTLISLSIFSYLAHRQGWSLWHIWGVAFFTDLWQGQVDAIVALGMWLALSGKNDRLKSVGLLLAMMKPQLSGYIIALVLLENRSKWYIMLAVPFIVIGISFIEFGNWIPAWVAKTSSMPLHVFNYAPRLLWPYSLFLLPVPFIVWKQQGELNKTTIKTALAISALMPNFSTYSYVILYLFEPRLALLSWLVIPASFISIKAVPMVEISIPLILLLAVMVAEIKSALVLEPAIVSEN